MVHIVPECQLSSVYTFVEDFVIWKVLIRGEGQALIEMDLV
jgi:hypothetical protein